MCYSIVYLVSACAKWWGSEPSWLSWLRLLMTVETCMACKQWYQQWPSWGHVGTSVHRNKRCASVVWWHICRFTGSAYGKLCHCRTLCLHTVVTRLQHYTALNEQQQLTSVHYILTDSFQHLWWTTANLLQSFPRGGGHRGFHFMSAAFHYYITPNMITEKSQISFDNWTYLQNDFNIPNKNQSIINIIHN